VKKFIILIVLFLLCASQAFAQNRGVLTNVFASWVSVTANTVNTVTFPANSRDIWIHNGSAIDVIISAKGTSIPASNYVDTPNSTFQLDGASDLYLSDFITSAVSFKSAGATASPVSVVVTY